MNGAIMKDNGIDKDTDNPWWSTYEKLTFSHAIMSTEKCSWTGR